MTAAFYGGTTFKRGDGGGPETFSAVGEVISLSGMGKTNDLIEATSFDSGSSREYIAGLADGQEITVECNYLPNNAEQSSLIADVDAGVNRNVQVVITDGVTPKTFAFAVTCLSWVINPAVDDRNTITFGLKISGDITVS